MDVRFMYLRDQKGSPVGCLAIRADAHTVSYGISVLNPLDDFDRVLARRIAEGRLNTGITRTTNLGVKFNMHEITRQVMTDLYFRKDAPTRARKAAKLWLNSVKE